MIAGQLPTEFTSDLRRAVSRGVRETGLPSSGHGWPFIRTQNWRLLANGSRASWIFRFLYPMIIVDSNSQVCFHKLMVTGKLKNLILHNFVDFQSYDNI